MCHQARSSASALARVEECLELAVAARGSPDAGALDRGLGIQAALARTGGRSIGRYLQALAPLLVCAHARQCLIPGGQSSFSIRCGQVEAGSVLTVEHRGEIALVTLQRPERRNALSIELRERLGEAFAELSSDDSVACVVLTGAGSAFCSGMDTTQFGGDMANRERLVETSTLAFDAVADCSRPVVAAVNGPALAGGFALSLLCDLRIAAAGAVFGYPELPKGIPPSYAAARAILPATVAQELCLTGRIVKAPEAHRLGIVRDVVLRVATSSSAGLRWRARSRSSRGRR